MSLHQDILTEIITTFDGKGFAQADTALNNLERKCNTLQGRLANIGTQAGRGMSVGSRQAQTAFEGGFSRFSANSMNQMLAAAHNVDSRWGTTWSNFRARGNTAISSINSKIDSLTNNMGKLHNMVTYMMYGMMLKSLWDFTGGLAVQREQLELLTSSFMKSKSEASSLINELDKMTDTHLVDLDTTLRALNTLKVSAGLNNDEMREFGRLVVKAGDNAYLQGFRGLQLYEKMASVANGLTGDWEVLERNFGGFDEKMAKKYGWSGKANDKIGYEHAFEKYFDEVIGVDTDALMETTGGRFQLFEKQARRAGRELGESFLPHIDNLVQGFLDLDPPVQKGIIKLALIVGIFIASAPFVMLFAKSLIWVVGAMITVISTTASLISIMSGGLIVALGPVGAAILLICVLIIELIYIFEKLGEKWGWWEDGYGMMEAACNNTRQAFIDLWEWLQQIPQKFFELGVAIKDAFWNGLEGIADKLKNDIQGAIDSFNNHSNPAGKYQSGQNKSNEKVANFARGLVNAFTGKQGLDQHSPGLIARSAAKEVAFTEKALANGMPLLKTMSSKLGSSMVRGYNKGSNHMTTPVSRNNNYNSSSNNVIYANFEIHDLDLNQSVRAVTMAFESFAPIKGGVK